MIELGKYGTDFIVKNSYWYNSVEKPVEGLLIKFENKDCYVKHIYGDSIVLQLFSNNQEDCIEIGY